MWYVQGVKQVQMLFNTPLANQLPDIIFCVVILQRSKKCVGFFNLNKHVVLTPNLNIISKVFG